ncbi:hypothetical protein [Actinokineospora iranica]|uniref:Zinc finger protein 462-like seventh C2H2 zinc finger domain-containing protein n=1 Tax=Actinokineospora iranica TaxID=1271860 RepID=A0A1G6Y9A2_9PSEU|nr:hypothetical protein [Actinokineospora iranica]SDD86155.1 hypothetical protein SAMN05216174_12061 [Actinokineospora iranica]
MTATTVNGVRVVDDRPTNAQMRDRAGNPILWQQTRTLVLADGRTVYGCAHCDYTSNNVRSIRPHLNRHRADAAPRVDLGELGGLTLAEAVARLAEHDRVAGERAEWKQRALAAERALSTLRAALRGVT